MNYKKIINTISISKDIVNRYIKEGDVVLDATVGNGNDTLELAKLVGKSGKVYGFDIQKIAIEKTKALLNENNLDSNLLLINDSHEKIDEYIFEPLDGAIYNLGYLPKGDKKIITEPKSTVNSILKTLDLLKNNGIIVIVSYLGHPGGMDENNALERMLRDLDQKQYNVLKTDFINQKNYPPILYLIEKA